MKLRTHSRRATQATGPAANSHDALGVEYLIDSYVCWREECAGVRSAYARWCRAPRDVRPLFYVAYAAALEQEEQAARVYQGWVERVGASTRADCAG
jgi:hypothetical protein